VVLLLLSCRHYLQRWARHACRKFQQRQQQLQQFSCTSNNIAGSGSIDWHAAAAAETGLKQRLTLWQRHKKLNSLKA
jgi:hypothetical protein